MNNEYNGYELVINDHSGDGMEEEFAKWVEENYPGVTARVASEQSAFYDADGMQVDEGDYPEFWTEFCNDYTE